MSDLTTVRIPQRLREDLVAACRSRLPFETCGVIFGYWINNALIPEGFSLIRNISPNAADSFAFDRDEWTAACYEAQKNQRQIVGVFHSHPFGATSPSKRDERTLVPWDSYWIIGFEGHLGEIAAYRHTEQGWISLPLVSA